MSNSLIDLDKETVGNIQGGLGKNDPIDQCIEDISEWLTSPCRY